MRLAGDLQGRLFRISESAAITFVITATNVAIGFQDSSGMNSLAGGGYGFVFADGGESGTLQCKMFKSGSVCNDNTSDLGTRNVHNDLQKRIVVTIRSRSKPYAVSAATAAEIKLMFSCIEP